MDPSLLQLFTIDEILVRLGYKRSTGCLHIFTYREAANIFFKEGTVVAAAKGLVEGEEVLKHALEWKDARAVWQPDLAAPMSFKPLQINIRDLVGKLKPEASSKSAAPEPVPLLIPVPVKAAPNATAPIPLPIAPPPDPIANPVPQTTSASAQLTATKTLGQPALARSAHEDALLAKHRLTLVSLDDSKERIKISRASSLIGRNPACDIALNHNSVSRQHCLLQITDRGLHVKDLGTTNGTKINGIGMTDGYISVGDKLSIGHRAFVLEKDTA